MIVNKGIDILENSINNESIKMKDFIKPSKAIKEIKLNWNERLEQHQTEEYSKQECLNLKPEATKYNILEYLKKKNGPFVNAE